MTAEESKHSTRRGDAKQDTGGGKNDGACRVPATPKPVMPLLAYQKQDVESAARFRWNCWSRQTGKSFTKSLRRILRGLHRGRSQIFLSAGERQSRELMDKARCHCQALKIACELLDCDWFAETSFKQMELCLPRGVRIIGLPANPMTARGYSGDILLDEFAMHASDREIWAAMFPAILRNNGELDVASTPKGCSNMFAKLRDNDRFSCSVVTLPDAVAQGLDVDIEEVRRGIGDEELFRQEFLCEFLDESTAFLTFEQIAACEDPLLDAHAPIGAITERHIDLFAGIDIGRKHDLTVIWVLEKRDDTLMTRRVIEMRGATFRDQFARIAGVLAKRSVRRCCIDAGGLGMQLAERCVEEFGRHRVEAVTFTAAVKSELASGLRIAVEDCAIRIPCDEAIRNDWHSIQRTVTAAGQIRYDARRGEGHHADRFWAAALAVHAAQTAVDHRIESLHSRPLVNAYPGLW